jgi:hypothetical protein
MLKKCIGMLLLVMLVVPNTMVFAANYDQRFFEVPGTDSYANAKSPLRTTSGGDNWAKVTSKTNQPRTSGTNPHVGTDLSTAGLTPAVYPIFRGKVVGVNHTVSSQLGSVILNHDIDGNGTFDDYYVEYLHINPNGSDENNGVGFGDVFNTSESIGTVDIWREYPPHLHFARTDYNGVKIYKLYQFYRHVSAWNYGSHLDYLSGSFVAGNELYITGYTATDNSVNIYTLERIELYYKINSGGTWQKSNTTFSFSDTSTYRYYINIKNATGASAGQTVYYYVAGIRNDPQDPTFSGTYKHGLYPQYYEHPALALSASYANSIARTLLIQ